MSSALPRAFAVIDLLVGKPAGQSLGQIAEKLDLPKSATHRILTELVELGYVRQDEAQGDYRLGLRMVSQSLRHLASIPLVDLAKPILDRLAELSGELARLSLPDEDSLIWVAKTQGARSGLRYDQDSGREVTYAHTSSGRAWLSALPRDRAIELLTVQGFDDIDRYGPNAARSFDEALAAIERVKSDGYSYTDSTFELGTATLAVPVAMAGFPPVGVLSITGPSVRLTEARALELVPHLLEASEQLAVLGAANG
jgi:IclR family acetate operon transcriptional repressor